MESDDIYSISLLTNTRTRTLVEEETTSVTTKLTTTKKTINSVSGSEGTPGTSTSSYYSSASSSAENISSTVENGDLSVFTFISPRRRRASEQNICSPSCTNSGLYNGRSNSGCHYCRDRHSNLDDSRYDSVSIDPFQLGHSHYSYKKAAYGQNHILNDNYVRWLPKVSEGLLLRSLEKGVLFPAVHWSSEANENRSQHSQVGHNVIFNQGVYKELKRVIPPDIWLQRDPSSSPSSSSRPKRPVWLIIGYKSLEKTLDSSLLTSWKEWTGVRHIYLNLRGDFEIHRISFLSRIHPQDNLDLFMYLVLMEIGNVDNSNLIWLLDFVQRTRVERMKGFLTVYTEVERGISSIEDEYLKHLSVETCSNNNSHNNNHARIYSSVSPEQPELIIPSGPSSSSSVEDVSPADDDEATTMEMHSSLKLTEKLLAEIRQPPLDDYF